MAHIVLATVSEEIYQIIIQEIKFKKAFGPDQVWLARDMAEKQQPRRQDGAEATPEAPGLNA